MNMIKTGSRQWFNQLCQKLRLDLAATGFTRDTKSSFLTENPKNKRPQHPETETTGTDPRLRFHRVCPVATGAQN